jgi:hypothetical protein
MRKCAQVVFFRQSFSTQTHFRLSHSLLQTHGFSPRDPFDPVSLLSLLQSDELSLLSSTTSLAPETNTPNPAHADQFGTTPNPAHADQFGTVSVPGPVPVHADPTVPGSAACGPTLTPSRPPDPNSVPAHAAQTEHSFTSTFESRRSADLRLTRWRVRFPISWDALARRHDLPAPAPLPASLGAHIIRLIHVALDTEDAVFARYHEALLADALSDVPARSVRAHSLLGILECPDPAYASVLARAALTPVTSPDLLASLRLGLVPFGTWAIAAALAAHSPAPPPEHTAFFRAVGALAPAPWCSAASIDRLLRVFHTSLHDMRIMNLHMPYEGLLPPLANMLLATTCASADTAPPGPRFRAACVSSSTTSSLASSLPPALSTPFWNI